MAIWQPNSIERLIRALNTSTKPLHVETDRGQGILKVLNNPEGPHALAKDWIGTQLAGLFGLPTFDTAIINITDADSLTLADGRLADLGPALIARYEQGVTWSGSGRFLDHLDNPGAIARLVAFDTWVLNRDRYGPDADAPNRRINRDNVWASRENASKNGFVLKAIDHSDCLTLGEDLSSKIARIDRRRFDGVFGLFPEFGAF